MHLKDTITGMTSNDWFQRLVAERNQAQLRHDNLQAFIDKVTANPDCVELKCPLWMLEMQATIMKSYIQILNLRLFYHDTRKES